MNFEALVNTIQTTNLHLHRSAVKAVNVHISLRNWLVGYYIVEYEQKGADRAIYGSQLLTKLANAIKIKGLTSPELSRCRQFYQIYTPILGLLTQEFNFLLPAEISGMFSKENLSLEIPTILGLSTQELQNSDFENDRKYLKQIFTTISYTHFVELIKIKDDVKRRFYELVILKTQPTVSELKRQINTLTFERLGLSTDHKLAFEQIQQKIIPE